MHSQEKHFQLASVRSPILSEMFGMGIDVQPLPVYVNERVVLSY